MYITGPNLNFENELFQSFLATHQEKYGEGPLSAFHAHAWDAAMMIFAAIEKVGVIDGEGNLHIGRQALRDAIYGTSGFNGITGSLSCDENGDCSDPSITVNQIVNGEYVGIWNDKLGYLEEAGGPTPPEGATKIEIWHNWEGAYLEAIEDAFDEFNATNDQGIFVELAHVDDISDALAVAGSAGEGPDIVAWVQDQIGRNALAGNIVPIADLEASGVNVGLLTMGRPFAGIKLLMLTANGYDRGNGEAAVEVIKHFTSAAVQKKVALINKTIPANTTALNDPELQAINVIAGFGAALNLAVPMPNHPFIDAQWGPVGDATLAIWTGAQSPQEALDAAQTLAEETVSEIKGE